MQADRKEPEVMVRRPGRRLPLRGGIACLVWAAIAAMQTAPAYARLKPETNRAFDRYIEQAEACTPDAEATRPLDGKVHLEPGDRGHGCTRVDVPDATVQNWRGAMFIPNASLDEVRSVLQDYGNYKHIYPEVIESQAVARKGDDFDIALRLSKNLTLMQVVLNTAYHVRYRSADAQHLAITSISTHIAEVKNAKASLTEEKPPGEDLGLLWRLNTYWNLASVEGGVAVNCQAISLSRDVPLGLGVVLKGFLERFPRESLQQTMERTRAEVLERHSRKAQPQSDPEPVSKK